MEKMNVFVKAKKKKKRKNPKKKKTSSALSKCVQVLRCKLKMFYFVSANGERTPLKSAGYQRTDWISVCMRAQQAHTRAYVCVSASLAALMFRFKAAFFWPARQHR